MGFCPIAECEIKKIEKTSPIKYFINKLIPWCEIEGFVLLEIKFIAQ